MAFSLGGSNGSSSSGKRSFRGSSASLAEINIIPLVDVVLVLLIIFMLTAHVMEFGLDIQAPEVRQTVDTAPDYPVVSITASGNLYLNEKPVNLHALPEELARRFHNAKTVYVKADRRGTVDTLVQVVSEMKDSNIGIALVAKPLEVPHK